MKRLFLVAAIIASSIMTLAAPLHARDHEPRWAQEREGGGREASRRNFKRDNPHETRGEGPSERRERMRALRDEMLRNQPRQQSYRDDDSRRPPPPRDRGDDARPPPSREAEGFRRMSPDERRQFRRQIYDAGRDAYRNQ